MLLTGAALAQVPSKDEQAEQKLRVGPAWQNDDQLVFTPALEPSLTLDGFTKSVKVLMERVVGESVSPHALRHSAALADAMAALDAHFGNTG